MPTLINILCNYESGGNSLVGRLPTVEITANAIATIGKIIML